MSTYFNIVNLDKKEQASLVIVKSQREVDATVAAWEAENGRKFKFNKTEDPTCCKEHDPEGFVKQEDNRWIYEIKKFFHHQQKLVFGFIFMEACGDQWGHVSDWFGDRVIIICDGYGAKNTYDFSEINLTYTAVKFYVSYEEWKAAQR